MTVSIPPSHAIMTIALATRAGSIVVGGACLRLPPCLVRAVSDALPLLPDTAKLAGRSMNASNLLLGMLAIPLMPFSISLAQRLVSFANSNFFLLLSQCLALQHTNRNFVPSAVWRASFSEKILAAAMGRSIPT